MVNKLNSDYELNLYQHALDIRAKRQEILANNVANADTPNFKARDIDFSKFLHEKLEERTTEASTLKLTSTSPKHINSLSEQDLTDSDISYRIPLQPSADGNTVDMDIERTQFADNSLKYEVVLSILKDKYNDLILAMQVR
ncbi:flagellar basal body rod protein FlgB [Nitrosomonas sp. JL21]|uniref:flagellar basal body rod protein FlgB n=1 Tax=Nitrosomonas sp. JL21 TaxID=153949 RepID=UPI00136A0B1A|nr:flagellar basal body rod protein FlgB [Nitrosomonas sp. JL21]MXS79113.1 flagellar basal body rod protein FlgB [Nitrosomonas sp. JL21]